MIYPDNFEEKIGFDKIRLMLTDLCLCGLGKKEVQGMNLGSDPVSIQIQLNRVAEFVHILLFHDQFPVDNYTDLSASFEKIKPEGTYLDIEELIALRRSLDTLRQIINFFKKDEDNVYPRLKELVNEIQYYPFIPEKIDQVLSAQNKIKDNASPQLKSIRSAIRSKQAGIGRKMQSILKQVLKDGIVDADTCVSLRDGRYVIPVPVTHKRRVHGYIHDESASGKTVFIEPAEVFEINNEVKELEYEEKREIIKILIKLTSEIRPYLPDLEISYHVLGTLDFIRAKALLAGKIEGKKPILVTDKSFRWKETRHPLLFLAYKEQQKKVVPLSLELDTSNRILIISGPNAGGKSVCLKTVGLVQYMLQCGLLVPMSENSEVCIFDNMFIHIGDEQSLENDLSTYSSHLVNMKYFLKHANEHSLILIDEFGTGTEPTLGGALAESILEVLNKNRTFGVITTHYTNLKHFASGTPGLLNGAMLFDTHKMQPLYILEPGKPGSSFAIEIARKIGLSEEVVANASGKIGEEHIHFDKHLREILRDKRYWEQKRNTIRVSSKKLDAILDGYIKEMEQFQKERKDILKQAREEAASILSNANKIIENTIREIKENKAEKEKTKLARQKLKEKGTQLIHEKEKDSIKQGSSLQKAKKQQEKNRQVNPELEQETFPTKKAKPVQAIEAGAMVKLDGGDTTGEVLDVYNDSAMVALGSMITTVKLNRLTPVGDAGIKTGKKAKSQVADGYSASKRKLNFKPEIDVRGKRGEEALEIIKRYIDDAIVVNEKEVRILHGKGNGILRQLIRDYLNTVDVVRSCSDEHIERGGAGITVVGLDY